MFYIQSSGWLGYKPFDRYQLPKLVPMLDEAGHRVHAKFRGRGGEVTRTKPLSWLLWPGYNFEDEADLPWQLVETWEAAKPFLDREKERGFESRFVSLHELMEAGGLPDKPPLALAYHMLVNYDWYGDDGRFVLAGLPFDVALRARYSAFVVDPKKEAALTYLKHLAETHRRFPLFTEAGDTSTREQLATVSAQATRMYFWMLQDCLFDEQTGYWMRGDFRNQWARLAAYIHWVGRTGDGCYASQAGMRNPDGSWDARFIKDMPELVPHLDAWTQGMEVTRAASHVSGRDPCVAAPGEVTEAPAL